MMEGVLKSLEGYLHLKVGTKPTKQLSLLNIAKLMAIEGALRKVFEFLCYISFKIIICLRMCLMIIW